MLLDFLRSLLPRAEARPDRTEVDLAALLESDEAVETLPRVINGDAFSRKTRRLYPPELARSGAGATVTVRLQVGVDGRAARADVVAATAPGFDAATLEAVRTLRFAPAAIDGVPVPVWVEVPVHWQVRQPDGR